MNNQADWQLIYILPRNWGHPSFDPIDSDSIANSAHMEQLIGTLTKMGPTGKYEPYLADSWRESEDRKFWAFRLLPNLKCSDGTAVDALGFVESLKIVLPIYAATNDLPVFNQLKGWKAFLGGDRNALGIRASSSSEILFEFDNIPKSGLLEYLSMPYYGLYCPGNFVNGHWKSRDQIISSGAYALERVEGDTIYLKKRNDFLAKSDAPAHVVIKRLDKKQALLEAPERTIFHTTLGGDEVIAPGWKQLTGVPTNLIGLAFGNVAGSPFLKQEFRRYLAHALKNQLPAIAVGSYEPAKSFYFDSPVTVEGTALHRKLDIHSTQRSLKILTGPQINKSRMVSLIEDMLGRILTDLKLKYEFYGLDPSDLNYNKRYVANDEWDIRLFNVSSGSSPKNWVVRMMFCSSMGINFLDPTKRICELVDRQDDSPLEQMDYVKRFENIVYEDSAVIPLFHMKQTWLYSADLDVSQVTSTADVPLFEHLRLKR